MSRCAWEAVQSYLRTACPSGDLRIPIDKDVNLIISNVTVGAKAFIDTELKQLIATHGKGLFVFNKAVFSGDT